MYMKEPNIEVIILPEEIQTGNKFTSSLLFNAEGIVVSSVDNSDNVPTIDEVYSLDGIKKERC